MNWKGVIGGVVLAIVVAFLMLVSAGWGISVGEHKAQQQCTLE